MSKPQAGWGRFLTEPNGEERVYSLDILRGFMALAVGILHFSQWTEVVQGGTRLNNTIAVFGPYGVEGFFIVSGFCFFHLYGATRWTPGNLAKFHIKRFFRIAPLYYAAVLGTLLLNPPMGTATAWQTTPRNLAENATLTFGLFHPNHSLVIGGWSIGLEYVFYFALPLLVLLTRHKAVLYLLTLACVVWAWPWNFTHVPQASHVHDMKFHAYVVMPNHAFLFLLGGVAAHLRSLAKWRLTLLPFLGLTVLLVLLAIPRGVPVWDTFFFMMGSARAINVTLCFLMVLVFALYDVPRNPLRTPLVLLGDLSYSVYLLHPFAYLLLVKTLPGNLSPLLKFSVALLFVFGLAYVVYRFLERPAMALGKRLAAKV